MQQSIISKLWNRCQKKIRMQQSIISKLYLTNSGLGSVLPFGLDSVKFFGFEFFCPALTVIYF